MSRPLLAEDVAARYGWTSVASVWKRTSSNTIPYVKRKGFRRHHFHEEDLEAWDRGAALVVVDLPDGGRAVKPVTAEREGTI